jgi:hypothetical protein
MALNRFPIKNFSERAVPKSFRVLEMDLRTSLMDLGDKVCAEIIQFDSSVIFQSSHIKMYICDYVNYLCISTLRAHLTLFI